MSDKPKCPVFGCTIPRGIPHEHQAGVSAVMRDPSKPLIDCERAELQYHRQQAAERNDQMVQAYLDDPITGAPKLRDALLMAGKPRRAAYFHGVNIVEDLQRSSLGMPDWDRPQRLTLVQIIGRIATGIVLFIGVAAIVILSAMNAGVL